MASNSLFHSMLIKYRLMLWYSLLFAMVLAIAGWIIFTLVQNTVEDNLNSELEIHTDAIQATINTSAKVAIRNHLRAIAEKNRDILAGLQRKVDQGEITLETAQLRARNILLSQIIGKSGYLYVITGEGIITVHPKTDMVGQDISPLWLGRTQKEQKYGYLEYDWKNPGEMKERAKALFMSYFAPWDWIISVSCYRDEFLSLLRIEDIREGVESLHFGKHSYSFILSGAGDIILHPEFEGPMDASAIKEMQELFVIMLEARNGSVPFT